jgi:trehalose 6-phosphate phosphatase
MNRAEPLERLLIAPPLALATDVDGTISEIAPAPELAIVDPRCRELLAELANKLPLVAVISGRRLEDARRLVGVPGIVYLGNHGLERWQNGQTHVESAAVRDQAQIGTLLEAARSSLEVHGLGYEEKGIGASIHYRLCANPTTVRRQVMATLKELSAGTHIKIVEGRQVIELRPSVDVDKGTALFNLLAQYDIGSAVYAGDDVTDLDAFVGLRRWQEQEGGRSLAVAVLSPEMPPDLGQAADVVVEGVEGWADLMETLLTSLESANSC